MFTNDQQILLYCKPIDLRMGQYGLLGVVREDPQRELYGNTVYLFTNKDKSLIKGLYWDRTGYIVFSKRLESGRFRMPSNGASVLLDAKRLRMFMDGLNLFL